MPHSRCATEGCKADAAHPSALNRPFICRGPISGLRADITEEGHPRQGHQSHRKLVLQQAQGQEPAKKSIDQLKPFFMFAKHRSMQITTTI